MTNPTTDEESGPIIYVRERIVAMPKKSWTRLAADAEVSLRTLYNLSKPGSSAHYNTVMKLHDFLKKSDPASVEPAAPAKRGKK